MSSGKVTALCPMCYRDVETVGGRFRPHLHTPMLAGATCDAGGKTRDEAKAAAVESVRKWREQYKAKKAADDE